MTKPAPVVRVRLTLEDVRTLQQLAHVYDKSARAIRFLVRRTSSRETQTKFRFVADESAVLEQLAASIRGEMEEAGEESRDVEMLLRALIAYWGRVLASLETPRARRKLSDAQIQAREGLATKLEDAARIALKRHRATLEREISTRRPYEAVWMRDHLGLSSG